MYFDNRADCVLYCFKLPKKRKSSEIFSKLLNRTVIAKTSGNIYLIYGCKFVKATLIPHLRLDGNKFAFWPLFTLSNQELDVNGGQHFQLRPDHRLTTRISFLTRQIFIKYFQLINTFIRLKTLHLHANQTPYPDCTPQSITFSCKHKILIF